MSVTWYTWLEQGRRINPSRQVLNSLAGALRLDAAETDYLFRLANEIPPTPFFRKPEEPVQRRYVSLLEQFTALPTLIVDPMLDVHACNRSALVLFPHYRIPLQGGRGGSNLLRLLFRSEGREFHAEWEEEAAQLVALFRSRNAEQLASPSFRRFVDELSRDIPEFGALWERQDLTAQAIQARRTYVHPDLGDVALDYMTLEVPGTPYFMLIYAPEPGSDLAAELAAESLGAAGAGLLQGHGAREAVGCR